MLSEGMSPVQRTDRTPPDLPAGGLYLIWEQEAAGSNPAIPTIFQICCRLMRAYPPACKEARYAFAPRSRWRGRRRW
jgi:hypothetical protein